MRALEDKIVKILQEFKSIKAIHIAKKLRTTKKYINPILYSGKNDKYQIDSDYRWSLKKENVKEKKVDRNKTYEKDLIKTETKSGIDSNKIGIKSLFNKYALVIPRPLIIELIKTQGVKINANEMMATQISHGKYLDIISVIEKNKSKGINNYLKKIKETQTQSHKNKSSDKPTKYIKRTLESPKMVKVYNKTIGEILYQFEIGLDVFKKELIELSHNLISNKVNIINNEGGIILTKKINNAEYQEIIFHLIKKGYKQFDKKKELRSDYKESTLSKVAKKFNVGISTIVDYLSSTGIDIDGGPNTSISLDTYDLIKQEFSNEVEKHKNSLKIMGVINKTKQSIKNDLQINKLSINQLYTKSDLYKIFSVTKLHQGGKWRNGYCENNGEYFIFANVGIAGEGFGGVHFDYKNVIDENGNLEWEAKNGSKIHHESIQKLIKSKPYIFIRTKDVKEPYWKFIGKGSASNIRKKSSPVKVVWKIQRMITNNSPENEKLKQWEHDAISLYNNRDLSFVKLVRIKLNSNMTVNECIEYIKNRII